MTKQIPKQWHGSLSPPIHPHYAHHMHTTCTPHTHTHTCTHLCVIPSFRVILNSGSSWLRLTMMFRINQRLKSNLRCLIFSVSRDERQENLLAAFLCCIWWFPETFSDEQKWQPIPLLFLLKSLLPSSLTVLAESSCFTWNCSSQCFLIIFLMAGWEQPWC